MSELRRSLHPERSTECIAENDRRAAFKNSKNNSEEISIGGLGQWETQSSLERQPASNSKASLGQSDGGAAGVGRPLRVKEHHENFVPDILATLRGEEEIRPNLV